MDQHIKEQASFIAPCGMNCQLCIGFQRKRNPCAACRTDSEQKPAHCLHCALLNCEHLNNTPSAYCYDCEVYPCARLKRLDKRYRSKYGMSMIENLDFIQREGIENFLSDQNIRWKCENCGGLLSVHRDNCQVCETKHR